MTTEKEQAEAIRSERNIGFSRGPLFLERDGVTLFQFTLDSSSVVGPRKATQADKEEHKGAWEAFNTGRLSQLDRDNNGQPGGSLPRRGRPPKVRD